MVSASGRWQPSLPRFRCTQPEEGAVLIVAARSRGKLCHSGRFIEVAGARMPVHLRARPIAHIRVTLSNTGGTRGHNQACFSKP